MVDIEAEAGGQTVVLLEFPQCRLRRGRLVPAKTPELIWRTDFGPEIHEVYLRK